MSLLFFAAKVPALNFFEATLEAVHVVKVHLLIVVVVHLLLQRLYLLLHLQFKLLTEQQLLRI